MCGLIAISWKNVRPSKTTLNYAIEMLADRGKDAWGIAIGENTTSTVDYFLKQPTKINLRKSKKLVYEAIKNSTPDGWLLLHSRLATDGYSGLFDHNHPVEHKNVYLIHNGLVVKWPNSAKNLISETKTDTQNLARIVQSAKPSELESILNEIVGEVSIVWQNLTTKTMKIYTNVGGLYLEKIQDQTLVSSEPLSIRTAAIKTKTKRVINL